MEPIHLIIMYSIYLLIKSDCIDRLTKHVCSWERASFDITAYKANIDYKLESCIYDYDVIYCNDIHCNNDVHRAQINEMYSTIISICLSASVKSIPQARPQCKIKDALDTSQFWHWVWLEAQTPMAGHIYCININITMQYGEPKGEQLKL